MKTDICNQQLSLEDQQAVRLARGLRAVVGMVIVGTIYFAMIASLMPELSEGSAGSATAPEQRPSSSVPASADLDKGLRNLNTTAQHA